MRNTIWQRRPLLLLISALMAGFGCSGIASANSITNTGPGSTNSIDTKIDNDCTIKNKNDVSVHNTNYQTGTTGDASVTDNTTAGARWSGWDGLNPDAAMADGTDHDAWWNGVVGWMSQHSSDDGWDSSNDNPGWSPQDGKWDSYDPVAWQVRGQSFGNWWDAAQHYLDSNSSNWLLGWPKDTTGSGVSRGSATSGSVYNNNNSSFTVAINNAASAAAGVNACGQNNFTPPIITPPGVTPPTIVTPPAHVAPGVTPSGGQGAAISGGKGGGQGAGQFGGAGAATKVSQAPTMNVPPAGGMGAGPQTPVVPPVKPPKQEAQISNTGPQSSNTISTTVSNETTIKNTNDVNICNTNSQTGTTGDATVTDNTAAGSATSGDVYNSNYTKTVVDISN